MANFQFIQHKPHLYKLATDAQKALLNQQHRWVALNCRIICETIVKELIGNGKDYFHNLEDKIDHLRIEETWKDKLHYLRKIGNKAAHTHLVTNHEALTTFDYMYQICQWKYPVQKKQAKGNFLPIAIGLLSAAFASYATIKTMNYWEEKERKMNP